MEKQFHKPLCELSPEQSEIKDYFVRLRLLAAMGDWDAQFKLMMSVSAYHNGMNFGEDIIEPMYVHIRKQMHAVVEKAILAAADGFLDGAISMFMLAPNTLGRFTDLHDDNYGEPPTVEEIRQIINAESEKYGWLRGYKTVLQKLVGETDVPGSGTWHDMWDVDGAEEIKTAVDLCDEKEYNEEKTVMRIVIKQMEIQPGWGDGVLKVVYLPWDHDLY